MRSRRLQSSKWSQEEGYDVGCCQVTGSDCHELCRGLKGIWDIERNDASTALASSYYTVAGV
jgi:hypothetical protein